MAPASPGEIPPQDKAGGLVSVIIPYYMQERYIRETVLSAVSQEGAQLEVIIIDDGSPVPAAPSLIGVEGIQVIRTENHGCAATRNFGFQQSAGEYLIFLDGDDVLQPGAVRAHLEALNKEPRAALGFGACRVIDEHGRELQPPYVCKPRRDYLQMLLEICPMRTPGMAMIRREALSECGGFDPSLSAQVDDYDLYLRLARRRPFVRHTFCVLNYRHHGTNVSRDRGKMQTGTLEVLDRFAAAGNLTVAERRRINYGRRRWLHHYNPESTLRYRLQGVYYKFRTMLRLPPNAWFS